MTRPNYFRCSPRKSGNHLARAAPVRKCAENLPGSRLFKANEKVLSQTRALVRLSPNAVVLIRG
jgi:hypothetical protein